jgi:hypothetical protein
MRSCPKYASTGAGGAGGAGGASSSTGGSGGAGGGTNCDPTKGAVGASCGVFVRASGDDQAAGDADHPLKTLSAALITAAKETKPVYACAEDLSEADTIAIPAGSVVFGGLDCKKDWSWSAGAQTKMTSAPDKTGATLILGMGLTALSDLKIAAAASAKPGGSSIALIVDGGDVTLNRVELVAGDAMPGIPGMGGGMQLAAVGQADAGKDSVAVSNAGGGGSINNTCGLNGGKGGDGGLLNSPSGTDGTQGDGGAGAMKGLGQTSMMACSPGGTGGMGAKPVAVEPGGLGLGVISSAGYKGNDGSTGKDGSNGTSGGGGGGSKYAVIHGAGGGGGGAGGCGGLHGEGGQAGGASIALISLNAQVTLNDCKLSTGHGGDGGAGGDGQFGQLGGDAGKGGKGGGGPVNGCDGGNGGPGGDGGNGGGGLGGPSIGIAYTKTAPVLKNTAPVPGTKGLGGKGGNMDIDGNHGDDGVAVATQAF